MRKKAENSGICAKFHSFISLFQSYLCYKQRATSVVSSYEADHKARILLTSDGLSNEFLVLRAAAQLCPLAFLGTLAKFRRFINLVVSRNEIPTSLQKAASLCSPDLHHAAQSGGGRIPGPF